MPSSSEASPSFRYAQSTLIFTALSLAGFFISLSWDGINGTSVLMGLGAIVGNLIGLALSLKALSGAVRKSLALVLVFTLHLLIFLGLSLSTFYFWFLLSGPSHSQLHI